MRFARNISDQLYSSFLHTHNEASGVGLQGKSRVSNATLSIAVLELYQIRFEYVWCVNTVVKTQMFAAVDRFELHVYFMIKSRWDTSQEVYYIPLLGTGSFFLVFGAFFKFCRSRWKNVRWKSKQKKKLISKHVIIRYSHDVRLEWLTTISLFPGNSPRVVPPLHTLTLSAAVYDGRRDSHTRISIKKKSVPCVEYAISFYARFDQNARVQDVGEADPK